MMILACETCGTTSEVEETIAADNPHFGHIGLVIGPSDDWDELSTLAANHLVIARKIRGGYYEQLIRETS